MGNLLIKLEKREMSTRAGLWERGLVPSRAPQAGLRGARRRRRGIEEDRSCNQTYSVMLLQTKAQKVKVKLNLWQIGSWESSPTQRRIERNGWPGGSE